MAYKYMCSDPGQALDAARRSPSEHLTRRRRGLLLAAHAPPHLPQGGRAGRAEPLPGRNGQHPRALLLGPSRPRRRPRPRPSTWSAWPWPRCAATMRWTRSRSRHPPGAGHRRRRGRHPGGPGHRRRRLPGRAGRARAVDRRQDGRPVAKPSPRWIARSASSRRGWSRPASTRNITLHTYSEVESVEGFVGNFRSRSARRPATSTWRNAPAAASAGTPAPRKKPQRVRLRPGHADGHLHPLPAGRAGPARDRPRGLPAAYQGQVRHLRRRNARPARSASTTRTSW